MSLRHAELVLVARELQRQFLGASVQKAWSPLPGVAYLELRHRSEEAWVSSTMCLCVEPEVARLSTTTERFSSRSPSPFQKWLRQELSGGKVSAIDVSQADRVVSVRVEGERGARALIAELRGTLVLLGADDRVLASSWATPSREPLRPGQSWTPSPEGLPKSSLELASRLGSGVDGSFAKAAEALFAEKERARRADGARRSMAQPLRSKRDRLKRTVDKVRAEAARGPEAERQRAFGELLSRNLHAVKRGQKEVKLVEYGAEGTREVVIPLDPSRSPKEQADRFFHQYRRLLRGSEAAARRLTALEAELQGVELQLQAAAQLGEAALLERAGEQAGAPPERTPQARPYREYKGAGGGRIWVGKTGEGNDELTFGTARPHDLWLHARGVPGAHVVIPLERKAELPQELLLDAAHLAMHHSQLKGEARAEVSYTQVKFVRRVKDGAPGQVTYSREKTFALRVEPDRLERLLRSASE